MAVELVSSTSVTNADATPPVVNNPRIEGSRVKRRIGMGELSATASIASIVRLVRIKSSDMVDRLLLSSDAITSAAADVGIYDTARNGGLVVDVDFFGSAVSLATAQVHADVTHEADPADAGAGNGLADCQKTVWEALGLSADPGKEYDIALTLTAAATAAGTVVGKLYYVDGN